MDVFSIDKAEDVDNKIDELIANKYNTIILSNDVAGLSEKINKEYLYNRNVNIIISKDREKYWNSIWFKFDLNLTWIWFKFDWNLIVAWLEDFFERYYGGYFNSLHWRQ